MLHQSKARFAVRLELYWQCYCESIDNSDRRRVMMFSSSFSSLRKPGTPPLPQAVRRLVDVTTLQSLCAVCCAKYVNSVMHLLETIQNVPIIVSIAGAINKDNPSEKRGKS